jgi:hypothetical protein
LDAARLCSEGTSNIPNINLRGDFLFKRERRQLSLPGLDDVAVVCQPIEHGGRHFGVAEHLRPIGEGQIGGDQLPMSVAPNFFPSN